MRRFLILLAVLISCLSNAQIFQGVTGVSEIKQGTTQINTVYQGTNVIWRKNYQTNPFNFSAWTPSMLNSVTGGFTDADGGTNGYKIVANTENGLHFVRQTVPITAGTYRYSVYAKSAEYNYLRFEFVPSGAESAQRVFLNMGNGTHFSETGGLSNITIVNAGSGWYKISVDYTTTATQFITSLMIVNNSPTSSFTGNNVNGIYIYKVELYKLN